MTAAASFSAVTKAFDSAVTSSSGDLWPSVEGLSSDAVKPVYIPAGGSATITVHIKAERSAGSTRLRDLYVDDLTIAGFFGLGFGDPNADEITAIPYSYKTK